MAKAVEDVIGNDLKYGIALIPFNTEEKTIVSKIKFYKGAKNNLPDEDSCNGTKEVFKIVSKLEENDLVIVLISGGGSSLLCLPVDYSSNHHHPAYNEFNLKTKLSTIKEIVNAGGTINELNTVRSCLSAVKAGKLGQRIVEKNAKLISLVISDVIGDPLNIIASGPTCQRLMLSLDNQKSTEALNIFKKYEIVDKIPLEVLTYLKSLKTNLEAKIILKEGYQIFNYLIGSNRLATQSIISYLNKNDSCNTYIDVLTNQLDGEAKLIGAAFACLAHFLILNKQENFDFIRELDITSLLFNENVDSSSIQQLEAALVFLMKKTFTSKLAQLLNGNNSFKIYLITGGETTVKLNGMEVHSKGGRNQEMTLSFELVSNHLRKLRPISEFDLLFSSFGTDGIDGPTDSAGAFYSYTSNSEYNQTNIESYLHTHNSYKYFEIVDRLIKIGPTGTNVSDIQILIIDIKK
jgi:glycerate 2-kinase